jgi:hypothetical protein
MGLAAIVGGIVGILYFPLHSLAYFATEGGTEGPIKWSESGRDLLEPLLDWDSADTVYRTYGKVSLVVVLGFVLGLVALRARRAGQAQGLERWAFGIAFFGYALFLVGVVVEYWTPYLDFGFLAFSAPGVLLTILGSTLLGIALLRRHAVTRAGAWLLALSIPLFFAMTAIVGHLSGGLLPLDLAWIVIGWWIWSGMAPRARTASPPQRTSERGSGSSGLRSGP